MVQEKRSRRGERICLKSEFKGGARQVGSGQREAEHGQSKARNTAYPTWVRSRQGDAKQTGDLGG